MADLLKKTITFLNRLIPKKKLILFNSVPDLSDNAYALYRYIREKRPDITAGYRLVYTVSDGFVPDERTAGIETVRKKSLRGYYLFLRAAYVVSTHGYFKNVRSGRGQIQLNLWHGCGYKAMNGTHSGYRGDYCFVTGEPYIPVFSGIFDVDEAHVLPLGLPRNDSLFRNTHTKAELGWEAYEKVILWLPTYRKANKAELGTDGDPASFGPFTMKAEERRLLEEKLEALHALLVIKPHMSSVVPEIAESSRVRVIDDEWIRARGLQNYDVLYLSDALWSDYSSVIVDYLLTGKPVAILTSDVKAYGSSRGFVFRDTEKYLPGPVFKNYAELSAYLDRFDEINAEQLAKREGLKKYFHVYADGFSAKRITDYFWS